MAPRGELAEARAKGPAGAIEERIGEADGRRGREVKEGGLAGGLGSGESIFLFSDHGKRVKKKPRPGRPDRGGMLQGQGDQGAVMVHLKVRAPMRGSETSAPLMMVSSFPAHLMTG